MSKKKKNVDEIPYMVISYSYKDYSSVRFFNDKISFFKDFVSHLKCLNLIDYKCLYVKFKDCVLFDLEEYKNGKN